MKYIDICQEEEIVGRLEKHSGCKVAKVPLENINPKTSYWVSSDGKSAFVLHLILDKYYIDRLTVTKSGYRSKKSRPFFRARIDKGWQIKVTLDRAVYGAFILKDKMPEEGKSIGLKILDLNNCSVENLENESDLKTLMEKNAKKFERLYIDNYIDMTKYCIGTFRISKELAEDIVSETFFGMLNVKQEIRNFRAVWVIRMKRFINFRHIQSMRINEQNPYTYLEEDEL